eukprot:6455389-Amphidinium_carterae.2
MASVKGTAVFAMQPVTNPSTSKVSNVSGRNQVAAYMRSTPLQPLVPLPDMLNPLFSVNKHSSMQRIQQADIPLMLDHTMDTE